MHSCMCTVHCANNNNNEKKLGDPESAAEMGLVRDHTGHSTHCERCGTNIIYRISPWYWSLDIVNSSVKVSVVVINKHAQRLLLFNQRSKSKCHLTECFWEQPWSCMFVTMETDKQRFLWGERKVQLSVHGRLEKEQLNVQWTPQFSI